MLKKIGLVSLIPILMVILVAVYIECIGAPRNYEQFGPFGDFVGGLINPVIGILTLIALIYTISRQIVSDSKMEMLNEVFNFRQKRKEFVYHYETGVMQMPDSCAQLVKYFKNEYMSQMSRIAINDVFTSRSLSDLRPKQKEVIMKYILDVSTEEDFIAKKSCSTVDVKYLNLIYSRLDSVPIDLKYELVMEYAQKRHRENGLLEDWSLIVFNAIRWNGNDVESYVKNVLGLIEYLENQNIENKTTGANLLRNEISRYESTLLYFVILSKHLTKYQERNIIKYGLLDNLNIHDVCNFENFMYIMNVEYVYPLLNAALALPKRKVSQEKITIPE